MDLRQLHPQFKVALRQPAGLTATDRGALHVFRMKL